MGLGREPILCGDSPLFEPAINLVTQLVRARAEGWLEEKLVCLSKLKPLIVDERGYLPFEAKSAHLFFERASRR